MQEMINSPYISPRFSDIKVQFEVVDTNAAEDATPIVTSEAEISKLIQSHNRIDEVNKKLATLEPNYFLLDGSFILPDISDNGEVGWWSNEISDENGNLVIPQVLEFNFTENHSSVGFTIIFDNKANEYCKGFTIQIYNSIGTLLSEDIVTDNTSSKYISDMSVDGFRKVKITFLNTSKSYRRVRVCEVVFGVIETFDRDNTSGLNILYEVSLNAEIFSSHELSIVINNKDRKYNMINPEGIYKYLQQGQVMKVQLGVGPTQSSVEKISMGEFYYSYSEAEDNSITARITAHDLAYTLVNTRCRLGTIGTWTVTEAVGEVITDSGMDINIDIPIAIGSRIINKCIPYNLSHRETLRMIAQASMCTCYFDRNDTLVFREIVVEDIAVDTLDNDNMFVPAKVSDSGRINKIELIVKNEYAETEAIYTSTNKEIGEKERVKSFDNPLAYDGQNVANWLLAIEQNNIRYELQGRGNPAREVGDTVKIYDAYNENRNAVIIREEFIYDGTLKSDATARGGLL